jgi:uncharacterized membrane protein YfcA
VQPISPESALLAGIFALILVSAALQSLSGFGFALLSVPILVVMIGGPQTVSTVLITGTACDLAILALRRSVPRPAGREVWVLGLWSAPGMLAGAWLLGILPSRWLQIFVACLVILTVVLRARSSGAPRAHTVRRSGWAGAAGFTSGALSTATSLGGPPTVLYLAQRGLAPRTMRDTLVTLSLVRLPLSLLALATAGVWEVYEHWLPLIAAALAGQFLGAMAFHRFAGTHYDRIVVTLLAASAFAALVAAGVP